MATREIMIDYEKIIFLQQAVQKKSHHVKLLHNRITYHMQTLRHGAWMSAAAMTFYREMDTTLEGVKRLENALNSAEETLAHIARLFKDAERAGELIIRLIPMEGSEQTSPNDSYSKVPFKSNDQNASTSSSPSTSDVNGSTSTLLGGLGVRRRSILFQPDVDDAGNQPTPQSDDPTFQEFMQAEPGTNVTLPNGLVFRIPSDHWFHERKAEFYNLLTQGWAYDGSLTPYLEADEQVQAITNGRGGPDNVNVDYYSVTLRLPNDATAQAIFQDITDSPHTLGGFDESTTASFHRRPDDDGITQEGDVFDLDMPAFGIPNGRWIGVHNGAVVVAHLDDNNMIVQTIYTPSYGLGSTEQNHGYHPVNGAREFGYTDNGDGTYTFYTMGADTPTNDVAGNIIGFARSQQDENWRNWQDSVETYARSQNYEITQRDEWRNYTEGWGVFSGNQTTDPGD